MCLMGFAPAASPPLWGIGDWGLWIGDWGLGIGDDDGDDNDDDDDGDDGGDGDNVDDGDNDDDDGDVSDNSDDDHFSAFWYIFLHLGVFCVHFVLFCTL